MSANALRTPGQVGVGDDVDRRRGAEGWRRRAGGREPLADAIGGHRGREERLEHDAPRRLGLAGEGQGVRGARNRLARVDRFTRSRHRWETGRAGLLAGGVAAPARFFRSRARSAS